MSSASLVGIIANPASGKDIRRLVAHGSAFDNNEKINIVRRVLLGLDAAGVEAVSYLPDGYGIVERAAAVAKPRLIMRPLPMPVVEHASDSTEAAERLRDLGAKVIVTLGGDGTNRAVAKGCGEVPLLPISTGTNNVFPRMIEGTLAGLAAGFVATGAASNDGTTRVVQRPPRLDVLIDGKPVDIALIDAVVSTQQWIGARAIWEPTHLREIVLSRLTPAAIGIASIGSALFPQECGGCSGAWITITDRADAPLTLTVPLAPGLMRDIPVGKARLVSAGETVDLGRGPCTIALDGEREIEVRDSSRSLAVRLEPRGPRVVDLEAALAAGARGGAYVRAGSLPT
ncbi:MAG: NAD(+)/NADH kinase [Thermomicrobiales bacterium]